MQIIDTHFHLWNLDDKIYSWLSPNMEKIYKDFTFKDFLKASDLVCMEACILIQAAASKKEALILLKHAKQNEIIKGVITWADMLSPTCLDELKILAKNKYFKGIRPMLTDISNINFINNPNFYKIFEFLSEKEFIFEALIFPKHLKNINILSKKFPDLKIIINHGAKPDIKNDNIKDFEFWKQDLILCAKNKNIFCKISGLLSQASTPLKYGEIEKYLSALLDIFGKKRLLYASDYPVVNENGSYFLWVKFVEKFLASLNEDEINSILRLNAKKIYKI